MERQGRAPVPPTTGPAPWVTPDAVALDLATATVGSRGIAYIIDLAVILSGLLAIALAELILGVTGFVPGWFGLALLLLFGFTLQFGYPIGFEVLMRGRTPGKAAMGLRVVTVEGLPVGVRHATIRAVIGLLELLGTFGMVAVISSLANARGQRLGDLAAGTVVLRERRSGGQPSAVTFAPPSGWETYVARLDVSGLGSPPRHRRRA
ncbi:MAG: RDD family protein [Intrasporangiaceae bacterium]|nr:RDD family protein [Intrasporangiaceae bacterium]